MEFKMIMVDECGDEVVIDTYKIGEELDEDYLELWKAMKIEKAYERFPEARNIYLEDMRAFRRAVNMAVHGFFY